MAIYLVSYDLNKSGQDYAGLYDALKSYGTWWHHLDSTWLIKTNTPPLDVFNKLKPHLDNNDNILIIEVKANYSGWLPQKAWDWIRENLG